MIKNDKERERRGGKPKRRAHFKVSDNQLCQTWFRKRIRNQGNMFSLQNCTFSLSIKDSTHSIKAAVPPGKRSV